MMCITPEDIIKTQTNINGITQNNCICENSSTEKEETKITHESFKDMYLNTINFNDTTEEDINFYSRNIINLLCQNVYEKLIIIEQQKILIKMFLGSQYIHQLLKEHCLKKVGRVDKCLIIFILFLIIQIIMLFQIG